MIGEAWGIHFAIVDCAARAFAQAHTAKNKEAFLRDGRQDLRLLPVVALRHLWKTGTPEQRVTIALRVAVWCGRTDNDAFAERIEQRELRRRS